MDRKQYFYLGNGGEHKIYTLRFYQEGFKYGDQWVDEKDVHVQNLSTDYNEAVRKGKERAGEIEFQEHPQTMNLNKYGVRASNFVWDGKTLCYGKKFYGMEISEIAKDDFGIQYLVEEYGFPSNPRQADIDCAEYVNNLPEVLEYREKRYGTWDAISTITTF